MGKIIAVINQKGGVGKSTTAATLMAGLTRKGYKVLGIDLDPQTSFSFITKADLNEKHILHVLREETKIEETIQEVACGHVIAATQKLSGADAFLTSMNKEYLLKEALEELAEKREYDFIIFDTPPGLGILTVNALVACNSVIIPAEADILSLQGTSQLARTMKDIKKYRNPALSIEGILLTRFKSRTVLSKKLKEYSEALANNLNTKVFTATIREAVAVKEAQFMQQDIFTFAPQSNPAQDYTAFVEEVLAGI